MLHLLGERGVGPGEELVRMQGCISLLIFCPRGDEKARGYVFQAFREGRESVRCAAVISWTD